MAVAAVFHKIISIKISLILLPQGNSLQWAEEGEVWRGYVLKLYTRESGLARCLQRHLQMTTSCWICSADPPMQHSLAPG